MTLRTAGLIAGVIGVILLLVAGVAQLVKPAPEANPAANVGATVVVIPPEVIALSPDGKFTFTGSDDLAAHTARTQDVAAWTASRTAVTVTGLADWESLTVTTAEPTAGPSASPSPSASGASPSATPSASPAKSPSPSASPSASASGSPSPTPSVAPTPLGSQDIWRNTDTTSATFKVNAASVPAGLSLVVESLGGGTVDSVSLHLPRTIDDAWITATLPETAGEVEVHGAAEMAQAIVASGAMQACIAKNLMEFALSDTSQGGAPLESCAVRAVIDRFQAGDKSFSSLLREIAASSTLSQRTAPAGGI